MEQLQTFLSRALPWSDKDSDQQSYVGIHWTAIGTSGKTYWTGRAARSVDEAIKTITWAGNLPEVRDIYIAMGSQREAEQAVSQKGNKYLKPIRNQNNVAALKDLYLDIDVKDGEKGYSDAKSAIVALLSFCDEIKLPRPTMVVSSGGGIHAHWELDCALSPIEWRPWAEALAEATRQKELKCDTQVTVDSARILRPPQTKNWKTNPPRETRLIGKVADEPCSLEEIKVALEPFKSASTSQDIVLLGQVSSKFAGIKNDAAADISVSRPVDLELLVDECTFIKEALETGGKDFGQPLWNLATLLATFTDNGRADAHRMASGHSDYLEETTDALFDRKMRERSEKNLGWPSCASIMNAGCTSCRQCKHIGEDKSPASFATAPIAVVYTLPNNPTSHLVLPRGYSLNKDGFISFNKQDDMGNAHLIPLIEYKISDSWAQKDPWILHFSAIIHDNIKSKIEIPAHEIMARDTLSKALAKHGIMTDPWIGKILSEFFVSWLKTLQARKNAVVESAPYGWNTNAGQVDGFCFGGEVWTVNGSRPAPNVDHVLRRQYQPTGSSDPWYDAMKLITKQGRPELEVIVASAFGAPLVKATGWYGAYISAYSQKSGIGKTTAMKIAQAVWADPHTAMQGLDDTINSVMKKIGDIRSLPLYWDEIKGDENTKKFSKLVFQLTSGRDKSRLGRDANLREVGKWQTMLISATNEAIAEYVAAQNSTTTAGLYRVFEFEVAKAKTHNGVDTGEAQRMLGKLDDNFGVIGSEYAKWLGQNYNRIDGEVGEYMKLLEKKATFKQDERFWLCTITCVVMGARYATELGFADFDIDEIEAFLLRVLNLMRLNIKDSHVDLTNTANLISLFTQFIKAMHRHTLWTNRVPKTRGRPKPGEFKIIKDASRLEGIQVHIGREDKLIRVSSVALSNWLEDKGVSRHLYMREFEKKFGAEKIKGRLGSGTDKVEGTENLIEIEAAGTPLSAFIDEATMEEAE